MEGTMSEIRMFAGNFPPASWAFCNGQLLAISENDALFSLIGTTYGGDGQTTFGLPDLRGRTPVQPGQGPGLSSYVLGQSTGTESNTLTVDNISNHSHGVSGNAGIASANGDGQTPVSVNNFPAGNGESIYGTTTDNSSMAPATFTGLSVAPQVGNGNAPIDNKQPYLAINFIICLYGIYPTQN
mgnify:FL=1|jgi:microcystin-dependent protein